MGRNKVELNLAFFSTSPRQPSATAIDEDEYRSRAKYSNMEDQKADQELGLGQRVRAGRRHLDDCWRLIGVQLHLVPVHQ